MTTEQSLRQAASAEEEDVGKEVSAGSLDHRREELGGGEGLYLHLNLPADPFPFCLSSS